MAQMPMSVSSFKRAASGDRPEGSQENAPGKYGTASGLNSSLLSTLGAIPSLWEETSNVPHFIFILHLDATMKNMFYRIFYV